MKNYDNTSKEYLGKIQKWSKAKPTFFYSADHASGETQQKGYSLGTHTDSLLGGNKKLAYSMEIPCGKRLFDQGMSTDTSGDEPEISGAFIGMLARDGEPPTAPSPLRWRYQPPLGDVDTQGVSFSEFRVLDFNGYDSFCEDPMPYIHSGTISSHNLPSGSILQNCKDVYVHVEVPSMKRSGAISMQDMLNSITANSEIPSYLRTKITGAQYIGVVLYKVEDNAVKTMYWACAGDYLIKTGGVESTYTSDSEKVLKKKIAEDGGHRVKFYIKNEDLADQDAVWHAKAFICSHPFPQNSRPFYNHSAAETESTDHFCCRCSDKISDLRIIADTSNTVNLKVNAAFKEDDDYHVSSTLFNETNANHTFEVAFVDYYKNTGTTKTLLESHDYTQTTIYVGGSAKFDDTRSLEDGVIDVVVGFRDSAGSSIDARRKFGAIIKAVGNRYEPSTVIYFELLSDTEDPLYDEGYYDSVDKLWE